jgi:hypothetical protein
MLSYIFSTYSLLPKTPSKEPNKVPNLLFKESNLSKPLSKRSGKLSNLRVCPVGAVSKTIVSYL